MIKGSIFRFLKLELCADFYFSRIFSYPCGNNDEEPETLQFDFDNVREIGENFVSLRSKLNSVKGKLGKYADGYDMRKDWHIHTENLHLFSALPRVLSREFGSELTTRAWLKFYDILARFPSMLDGAKDNNQFVSFHLCEAPGAFISALNHRFDSQQLRKLNWKWFANTLNPYHELSKQHEAIFDDQMIACHEENWLFGNDNTGNILDIDNLKSFSEKINCEVDLVSADGAIGCQDDPAAQELTLSRLHLAEVLSASTLLRKGGSMVIKLFTLFERKTASLVYLLTKMFESVNVYKPAASKPGNSEVYFICLNLRHKYLKEIAILFENEEATIKMSEAFLKTHEECVGFFVNLQMEAIERNIFAFEQLRPRELQRLYQQMYSNRYSAENFFITKACSPLLPLSPDRKLLNPHMVNHLALFGRKIHHQKFGSQNMDIVCDKVCDNRILDSFNIVVGKMPTDYSQVTTSIFCSIEKLPMRKSSSINISLSNSKVDQVVKLQSNNPHENLKHLCDKLLSLRFNEGDNVSLEGITLPITRPLAGLCRLLLVHFERTALSPDGSSWLCINWSGPGDRFDQKIISLLENVLSKLQSDSKVGICEIINLHCLVSDRCFLSSISHTCNFVLDLLLEKHNSLE